MNQKITRSPRALIPLKGIMAIDHVCDNIFISDMESASCKAEIERNKIGAILSVGCDVRLAPGFSGWEGTSEYLALPDVYDRPEDNLIRLWPEALRFMALTTRRNVVVHCVYGQSRSAATIVAYLTSIMSMGLDEALSYLKERCPRICINPGFLSQLHLWVNRRQFRAEFQLLCPNGTELERERGNDDHELAHARAGTSSVVHTLRCQSCRRSLFQISSESTADKAPSSQLWLQPAGLCDMTRNLLNQSWVAFGPAPHDVDADGGDLRNAVLQPRPGAKELIDRHVDPYYHDYISPYQYERPPAAVLSFPLLLSRGELEGRLGKGGEKGKKKDDGDGVCAKEHELSICLAAVPGGWVDAQSTAALCSHPIGDLYCPQASCSAVIGCCKENGLRLCDGFIKTRLVGLFARAVYLHAQPYPPVA